MRLPLGLRKALSPLVARVPVRIRSGPNAGARWSLAAAGRHRTGAFEASRVEAILALVRPGDCVWDIGAHHGYVSLAVSRAVGPQGHVYALEPSRYNFALLRRHAAWNAPENLTPMNVGVAAAPGRVEFGGGGSSQTFRIGGGTERVELTSLEVMAGALRAPDVVKLDIEGAEGETLRAGARHLPPTAALIVSIHSLADYRATVETLGGAGFALWLSEGVRRRRELEEWGDDDPDLIALGPERGELAEAVGRLPGFTAEPPGFTSGPAG